METIKSIYELHGVESIVAFIPLQPLRTALGLITYTSSNDKHIPVPCVITESRYKVADDYKVEFMSTVEGFGKQSFYQTDFNTLVRNGDIKVYVNVSKQFSFDT
jgi:hypothetical protein